MKKRLKWIISLCFVLLVAVGVLTLALRYRSSGQVLLSAVTSTRYEGTTLFQVREKGARFLTLSDASSSKSVYSPNGRYLALSHTPRSGAETVVYDTLRPRRPILRVEGRLSSFQPTDDGHLVYVHDEGLYHSQRGVLAENIHDLGPVSCDGSAIYCFRPMQDGQALCRVDLSDGSLTPLLENVQRNTLQIVQDKNGQDILICAQKSICKFTAYDLVRDELAAADAASGDEAAQARNELRNKLKEEALSESVYTIWRIAGGKQEILAEGAMLGFFCDPLTGMVVHRLGRLFTEPVNITSLREAHIPSKANWYCTVGGTRTMLEELHGITETDVFSVQFSGTGLLAIQAQGSLYLRENGSLGSLEVVSRGVDHFGLVHRSDGVALYFTSGRTLYCHAAGQTQTIQAGVWTADLPCRRLPDGTVQLIDDLVYVRTDAPDRLHGGEKPPATLSQIITWPPSELYVLQGGEKTLIATIGNVYLSARGALPDGSLLCEVANTWRVLGPTRDERLAASTRFCYLDDAHCESFLIRL